MGLQTAQSSYLWDYRLQNPFFMGSDCATIFLMGLQTTEPFFMGLQTAQWSFLSDYRLQNPLSYGILGSGIPFLTGFGALWVMGFSSLWDYTLRNPFPYEITCHKIPFITHIGSTRAFHRLRDNPRRFRIPIYVFLGSPQPPPTPPQNLPIPAGILAAPIGDPHPPRAQPLRSRGSAAQGGALQAAGEFWGGGGPIYGI